MQEKGCVKKMPQQNLLKKMVEQRQRKKVSKEGEKDSTCGCYFFILFYEPLKEHRLTYNFELGYIFFAIDKWLVLSIARDECDGFSF